MGGYKLHFVEQEDRVGGEEWGYGGAVVGHNGRNSESDGDGAKVGAAAVGEKSIVGPQPCEPPLVLPPLEGM